MWSQWAVSFTTPSSVLFPGVCGEGRTGWNGGKVGDGAGGGPHHHIVTFVSDLCVEALKSVLAQ